MKNIFVIIAVLLAFASCGGEGYRFSSVEFVVPEYIKIDVGPLKKKIGETDPSSPYSLVVVVYGYSTGVEKFSFSGGEMVNSSDSSGRIRILLKVMEGKQLKEALFVEAEGHGEDEILSSLITRIKEELK